nr:MAG TPA: hypothetical protein [Caudoviricetes sp.]
MRAVCFLYFLRKYSELLIKIYIISNRTALINCTL